MSHSSVCNNFEWDINSNKTDCFSGGCVPINTRSILGHIIVHQICHSLRRALEPDILNITGRISTKKRQANRSHLSTSRQTWLGVKSISSSQRKFHPGQMSSNERLHIHYCGSLPVNIPKTCSVCLRENRNILSSVEMCYAFFIKSPFVIDTMKVRIRLRMSFCGTKCLECWLDFGLFIPDVLVRGWDSNPNEELWVELVSFLL